MKTVYRLDMPGDCEGRSISTVAHFSSETIAKNIGKTGYGNMSMGKSTGYVTGIVVYETAEEFYRSHPQADPDDYPGALDFKEILKERALSKLTAAEKAALGLE